jgi:iron-sulfur cluster assembly protein
MEQQTTQSPAPKPRAAAFSITENAARRIDALRAERGGTEKVLLVGIKTKGCSGMSYAMDFISRDDVPKGSENVTQHGVTVAVDPKASMFLFGTVMDYSETPLQSGFTFTNPNETGRCGCGESFTVGDK